MMFQGIKAAAQQLPQRNVCVLALPLVTLALLLFGAGTVYATAMPGAPVVSAPAAPAAADAARGGTPDLPAGASQEWWAGVQAMIYRDLRTIAPETGTDGTPGDGYTTLNPAEGLQIHFPSDGGFWVTAAPAKPDVEGTDAAVEDAAPAWRWGVRPQRLRIGDAVHDLGRPQPAVVSENQLEQRYRLDGGGLTEWFVNEAAGLRQNFTLDSRPAGPADQPLVLELTGLGSLIPSLDADGQGLTLRDEAGSVRLVYDDLYIYDANGKTVPGHFALGADPVRPGALAIAVDDAGAVYPLTIDPLTGSATGPDFTATGEGANNYFGYSVAGAGDVNGDGYADVIVGAYGYSGSTGRAYVYHGGASGLSASPAFTATGEGTSNRFGQSVAGAGDVNGDGYADVIVGAYGYSGNTGRAYVYHGGASGLSASPAFTATGQATSNFFGISVAGAGDVNGDGYADVIVGARGYNSQTGRAYVYHGGVSGLNASPAFTATGQATNNNFGNSVAGAGDVNGDGYADVIVGADVYNSSTGRVYVYHGGASSLSASPAFTATGEATSNNFGTSVAGAGDVNGDGYADVIVGAWGHSSSRGRAYVYQGGASGLSASPAFTATGQATSNYFGTSVAGTGDVNGDGYADVIVGASGYDSNTGRAYVYQGGASGLSASPAFTATGEGTGNNFGWSVAGAGDVNGDGFADVIVGAYSYSSSTGRAYVYHGGASGLRASPAFTASGEGTFNRFGASVAGAGDVNGDGYADVIVGAYSYSGSTGRAYVYHGGASGLSASPAFTATGGNLNDSFGVSVAGAGDVNGDGYADVIVGAYGYTSNTGRVYVYHGGASSLNASPAFTATGENTDDQFGWSVAGAGDVNGDGYADVIVGAYGYNSLTGRAYVYHGGVSGLSVSPAFTATGGNASDFFGTSVAGAGDVNGDGYADVIVGAPGYSSQTGRVYVYHGGASSLGASPAFTATGEATGNNFGLSVAGAGDVNGDGFADVIVGARGYSSSRGRAYVYHGGASGLSASPAFTATGQATSNTFGISVAGTGDVNGDGFADVIVGARGYSGDTGRAYVFHGGASGLNASPAFTATGEATSNLFGFSVAGAGDVNGDGFADVIVGASGHSSNRGRAYVYQGGVGRAVLAGQLRGGGSAVPVQPWGAASLTDAFDVRLNATAPAGRQQVKLQVEACPPGAPFGGVACVTATSLTWSDVTTASVGIPLTGTLSGLSDGDLYRWRARVLYAPFSVTAAGITAPPNPAHGPWRRLNAQAVEADVRTTAVPRADLSIVKTVAPALVAPGGAITYTLGFTNAGPHPAAGVTLSDSIPLSVTITGVTSSTFGSGVSITQTSGSPDFAWAVSDLAVGAGGAITLTGTVAGDAWAGLVITNSAAITASSDSAPGNNSSSAAFTVARLDVYPAQPGIVPNVSVTISATVTPAQAGIPVNFAVVAPGGGTVGVSAVTDANGVATVTYTAPGSTEVVQIEGSVAGNPALSDRATVYVAVATTAGGIARSAGGDYTIGNLAPNHIQVQKIGTGTPILGWAEFAGNPCPTTLPGSNVVSPYVDAMVEDATDVSAIVVTLKYTGTVGDASQYEPFWCNNGTWAVVVAPLTVYTPTGTLVFTLTGATAPTLLQLDGTPFAGVGPLGPTAVTVDWFAAAGQPGQVQLTWQTVNEVGLYGFHLYRGLDPAGPGERITGDPVPALGAGGLQGFAYAYDDFTPRPAATVYYWLEELHGDGPAILHGPELVTSAQLLPRLYLPLVSQ